LEVRADQARRTKADWVEVTVQAYATGEVLHQALYNPAAKVSEVKLALQTALGFAPPVIDASEGFEVPLRPGQV
jgi:hypothetical protein